MLLTEEDARLKLCPHLRADLKTYKTNGGDTIAVRQFANCRAAACMQWRFIDEKGAVDHRGRGYCGLAGRPEVA